LKFRLTSQVTMLWYYYKLMGAAIRPTSGSSDHVSIAKGARIRNHAVVEQ